MGRGRSRSRSYSPKRRSRTPPRRKRYDDPCERERHHHRRRSPAPCGLLVRNVALDTRPEDLRIPFEKFGPVKDVYLPRNYYTGEPRGFAFVKFRFPEDAAEAKDRLSHTIVGGREIRIVYAEENRKTPQEMRKSTRISGPSGRFGGRRRTSPRSPRRQYHSCSRSPVSRRRHSRFVSRSRSPCRGRHRSTERSLSPRDHSSDEKEGREVGRFQSPKEGSPYNEKRYKSTRRSHSSTDLSPHEETYKWSRSPTIMESSLHDRKNSRSSGRSISPRKESPLIKDCKAKHKEVSYPGENYRSNKRSLSPQDLFTQDDRGMSNEKIPSPRNRSSDYEKVHRFEQRSISPEENASPRGSNLASSSPRMNA